MRTWKPALILIAGIALSACGSDPTATPRPPSATTGQDATTGGQATGFGSIAGQATAERMIVRDADLELAFDNVAEAAEQVEDVVESHGGRVQSTRVTGDGNSARGTVVARVPSASFGAAVDDIKGLARRVESEETSSDDVTDEYVDLDAQVRNLQVTEAQLQTIMERASSISDVLNVQRELTKVRDEIERFQGRMQLLSQTAAESLITVALFPASIERPIVDDSWSFARTLRFAIRGLLEALQVVVNVGTWVVVLSPIWGPIAALAWLAGRKGWLGGPRPGAYGTKAPSPPTPPAPPPSTDV